MFKMRLSLRRILVGTLICFALILFYLVVDEFWVKGFSPELFLKHDIQIKEKIHYSNYRFSGMDDLLDTHDDFKSKLLDEKCTIFYEQLQTKQFKFPLMRSTMYNKDLDKMKSYFDKAVKRFGELKETKGMSKELTRGEKKEIRKEFKTIAETTMELDQKMADAATSLRIYGKCSFSGENKIEQDLFNDITKKMFHYLTFAYPVFEYVEGSNVTRFNSGIPEFKDNEFTGKVLKPEKNHNLIQTYHKYLNGRGIVISAGSNHFKDIARLLRVLRALNNQLPIEIVHRGNLSPRTKGIIYKASYADMELDAHVYGEETVGSLAEQFGSTFPIQKVFFVNVKPMVPDSVSFKTYNNKILSLAFSSFKEVIHLDADSIPLIAPEKFFESQEYKESGTYFFKDRSLRDTNDYLETNFVQKLFPMNENGIDSYFDIPTIDKSILRDNNYIRGYRHFQEAGVVVLDKVAHFASLLTLLPLGVWKEPLKTAVWGDKEFYWMSFLMAGDSNFRFNKNEAASIGVESSKPMKLYNADSHEVCSTHPGHIDDLGQLLWINSGYSFCKKNSHYSDKAKYPFSRLSFDELREQYDSNFRITHALIPPSLPNYRDLDDETNIEKEKKITKHWKSRKEDLDQIKDFDKNGPLTPKIDYFPQKGWVKSGICAGYYYCAYDKIESYGQTDKYDKGTFYYFNQQDITKFDFLSAVWSSYRIQALEDNFFKSSRVKTVKIT